jgi:MFS transporter, DHA1 family, multidrug resistance protein
MSRHSPLGLMAFIALTASMMALNSLAIDLMLPGFPQIRAALNLTNPNAVQAVVTTYLVGFGIGQAFIGLLADRFGRRPILLVGLGFYVISAVVCAFTSEMSALLAARFIQGLASSAPRVVAIAIVRDCYTGRIMARVMSLNMMIFMAAPILGPAIGQSLLLVAPWRGLFGFLALYGGIVLAIGARFLPETLNKLDQRKLDLVSIRSGVLSVLTSPRTMGYAVASGVFYGALMALVGSSQQLMVDVFGLGGWYPLALASVAISLALSQFVNSWLIGLAFDGSAQPLVCGFLACGLAVIAILSHPSMRDDG